MLKESVHNSHSCSWLTNAFLKLWCQVTKPMCSWCLIHQVCFIQENWSRRCWDVEWDSRTRVYRSVNEIRKLQQRKLFKSAFSNRENFLTRFKHANPTLFVHTQRLEIHFALKWRFKIALNFHWISFTSKWCTPHLPEFRTLSLLLYSASCVVGSIVKGGWALVCQCLVQETHAMWFCQCSLIR